MAWKEALNHSYDKSMQNEEEVEVSEVEDGVEAGDGGSEDGEVSPEVAEEVVA